MNIPIRSAVSAYLVVIVHASVSGVSHMQTHCPLARFYKKMGFHELFRSDSDLILGLRFPENCPVVAPPPLMSGVLEGRCLCSQMESAGADVE